MNLSLTHSVLPSCDFKDNQARSRPQFFFCFFYLIFPWDFGAFFKGIFVLMLKLFLLVSINVTAVLQILMFFARTKLYVVRLVIFIFDVVIELVLLLCLCWAYNFLLLMLLLILCSFSSWYFYGSVSPS